jgi:hypothetical protein
MNTKIRLATPLQITALTAAWLAVLLLIDYTKNPHLWNNASPSPAVSVPLSLWVNHLCCSGCLSDVTAALEALPWVGSGQVRARQGTLLTPKEAEARGPAGEYGGWVDVQVKDPTLIDFVAVDRALRDKGLVASRMELGGLAHFRLEAQVAHLCCSVCSDAAQHAMELSRALSTMRLGWVDSVSADHVQHRIVVYARYLEPGKTIDVAELLGALDQVGLAPFSLRAVAGTESATTGGSRSGR